MWLTGLLQQKPVRAAELADMGMEAKAWRCGDSVSQAALCSAHCSQDSPPEEHRPPEDVGLRLGARKHFTHIKSSFSSVFPISNHQIKGLRPLSTVVLLTHVHPGGTKAQLA